MPEWITVREAADILGVHMSAVPKMIRRGDLTPRDRRPRLNRAAVVALRAARAAANEKQRQARRQTRLLPQPPDADHEWLSAVEAGDLMGIGPAGVRVRARRGRLPCVTYGGRVWFRRDHLELVRRADQAKRKGQL